MGLHGETLVPAGINLIQATLIQADGRTMYFQALGSATGTLVSFIWLTSQNLLG